MPITALLGASLIQAAQAATVTTTADSGPGSLRDAIAAVNADPGDDTISFAIGGAFTAVHTITLSSALPAITDDGVTIDGTTQGDAACGNLWAGVPHRLRIEVAGAGADIFEFTGSNGRVRGMSLTGGGTTSGVGIRQAASSAGMTVDCSYVGVTPAGAGSGLDVGIDIYGGDLTVGGTDNAAGNVVSGNRYGVLTRDGSSGFRLVGNFVGTNPGGDSAIANTTEAVTNWTGTSEWIEVRDNLISGNDSAGIEFDGDEILGGLVIAGNYIGVDRTGVAALANSNSGISIFGGSDLPGLVIGGTSSSERNVIAGNALRGITIREVDDYAILGNYVGIGSNGLAAIGNGGGRQGMVLDRGTGITIGDGTAAGRNVVGANDNAGIELEGVTDASVRANYIGVAADGSTPVGNSRFGIFLQTRASDGPQVRTLIDANVISANGFGGVDISSSSGTTLGAVSSVTVTNNKIGTAADGVTPRGNTRQGIKNTNSLGQLIVGGPGGGNIIAYNGWDGIEVGSQAGTVLSILGNDIYDNGRLGIQVRAGAENADNVNLNDPGDTDTGPNGAQNYADIAMIYANGGPVMSYDVNLDTQSNPDGYRVEFFKSASADPSGFGEGGTYLGGFETGAYTAGSDLNYTGTLTTLAAVSAGDVVTTTATRQTGPATYGGTSEFSMAHDADPGDDYSDAPLTGTSYGAARHFIVPGRSLGVAVTGEAAAFDSPDADGDADDGATLPAFTQGADAAITLSVAGDGGYLHAWLDLNADGDWADTVGGRSERVATDIQDGGAGDEDGAVNGEIVLALTIPPEAMVGQTFARFRWSRTAALDANTAANDGEVEDYALTIAAGAMLEAARTVAVFDPASAGLFAIPGNDMVYEIVITNRGGGDVDADTITIIDEVEDRTQFFNGATTAFGGAVVGFTQTGGAGLSLTPSTDVRYSDAVTRPASFADCTYTPSSGYDANVRFVCLNPKGTMRNGDPDPAVTLAYRVGIR